MRKKHHRHPQPTDITTPNDLYRHLLEKLNAAGPKVRISGDLESEIASASGYIDNNQDAGTASWEYVFGNTIIDDGSVAASMLPECSWDTLLFMGRLHSLRVECSGEPPPPAYILMLLMDQFRDDIGLVRSEHISRQGGVAITGTLVINRHRAPLRAIRVRLKSATLEGYKSLIWDPVDKMAFDFAMPAKLSD